MNLILEIMLEIMQIAGNIRAAEASGEISPEQAQDLITDILEA